MGKLFCAVSGVLIFKAFIFGGWHYLWLWPAISFAVIGISYIKATVKFFGKKANGRIDFKAMIILFPYLVLLWIIWHVVRFVQKEKAYHTINDNIIIGRRLLDYEIPVGIDNIIDLTCEFQESKYIIENFNYKSFPILDASITDQKRFITFLEELASYQGCTYIHCAQGHGRTATITSLLLILTNKASNPTEAMAIIHNKRPLAKMKKSQWKFVNNCFSQIRTDGTS
ncbi:dual specificity protein phosphatase family protein [Candidatus Uabimicrobium sp. HlEnr_7]|uniref:dual specificity protein phosphatase family protein n=1 Tax=Candidatus Uabimicrobium helgolandensis TaxID=3095367 RepID=UPI00355660DF